MSASCVEQLSATPNDRYKQHDHDSDVGVTDIKSPGTVQVWIFTPTGAPGVLGCSSGGNCSKASLTVK